MKLISTALIVTAATLALSWSPLSSAATPIKAVAKVLDTDGSVEVHNVRGAVRVIGWERNAVALTGSLGEDTRLSFDGSNGRLVIRAERVSTDKGWFGGWVNLGPKEDTVLELHVPFTAALEVSTVSADIKVRELRSSASLKSETVSGDVDVVAEVARLQVSSVSGNVDFSGKAARTDAETVSGDLHLSGLSGELSIDSVSGDVTVTGAGFREIEIGSVSGDLQLDASLAATATVKVESLSGDIRLTVPSATSARVNAETFSGSISTDFDLRVIDEEGPGKELHGKIGSGDARINLESFSGDVDLRQTALVESP